MDDPVTTLWQLCLFLAVCVAGLGIWCMSLWFRLTDLRNEMLWRMDEVDKRLDAESYDCLDEDEHDTADDWKRT